MSFWIHAVFYRSNPYLNNVILQILGHVGFIHFGEVVVGHRAPPVDPVELQQKARLAVVVPVVLLTDALDVAALENGTQVGYFVL